MKLEKAAPKQPYNLILMDWEIPQMDGIETSKRIKSNPGLDKIPAILMVSAYGREELRRQAEEIGLDGFLTKPVNRSLLFDTIMEVFGKEIMDKSRLTLKENPESIKGLEQIRGARILLVEDNEINQQVAMELLENEGFIVEIADNGKKGFEKVDESNLDNPFDAILMDIQMPLMDGHAATREIRNLKTRNRNLPVIAMTAHAMAGEKEKCLKSGMNDYVSKPIDPNQLFLTLVKWIKPRERATATGRKKRFEKRNDDILPETLAGINVTLGLERVAGNRKMYIKLLLKFRRNHSDVIGKIVEAINTDDFASAGSLCHTIKGISGNIGAETLFKAASELESFLRQGNDNDEDNEIETKLNSFLNEFHHIMKSIEGLEGVKESEESNNVENIYKKNIADKTSIDQKVADQSTSFDQDRIHYVLTKLMELMETDISRASEHLSALKEILEGSNEAHHIRKIEQAMEEYDTDLAMETLNHMAQGLGIRL